MRARELEAVGVRLWLLDLNAPVDPAHLEWLSAREADRASRFHDVRDRQHYLAAHCGLRQIIEDFAGIAARRVRFSVGALGKPSLCGTSGIYFSISYADDRALVGMSSSADIGVDLEVLRTIEDAGDLADEYFTESERIAYSAAKAVALDDRCFLQGWTRKEACIKAVGLGLSLHPANFTCGLSSERVIVKMPVPNEPRLVEVQGVAIADDLVAACAVVVQ